MGFFLSAIILALALSAMGFGIFISMRIFQLPDITTDGSYTLGAAITAVGLVNNWSIPFVLIAVLGTGFISGLCTGIIHTRLKVNPLLSGILVMTALYSINLEIMGRSNIPLINIHSIFDSFKLTEDLFLQQSLCVLIVITLSWGALSYLLKTDYGLAMRATGSSETMVRSLGSNTKTLKATGLGIANAFTALSGCIVAQYQGFADINMGIGIVIAGLGSVMIGETMLSGARSAGIGIKLLAVVGGSICFRLILALALYSGIDPNLLKLITALLVLVVVSLPALGGRIKLR